MTEPSSQNFSATELRCKCELCGGNVPNKVNPDSLRRLQRLREVLGFPLTLNSAYRCAKHPVEARKMKPGRHNMGKGFDIAVGWGQTRMQIVEKAMELGFTGFGFANGFLHIDDDGEVFRSWSYS